MAVKKKKDPVATPILINDWLRQPPLEEELTVVGEVRCLINRVIEEKLDRLTMQTWSTFDYKSKYFTDDNGRFCISASLLLEVTYGVVLDEPIRFVKEMRTTRTLIGAVTYPLDYFPDNTHYDNTAKTLCIGNAASELGVQFGRGLNDVEPVVTSQKKSPIKRAPVKTKPDIAIMKKYQDALLADDKEEIARLTSIYDIKTN